MSSRAQICDRAAVLRERVELLVSRLAEFENLRRRMLRTEQEFPDTSGLSEGSILKDEVKPRLVAREVTEQTRLN